MMTEKVKLIWIFVLATGVSSQTVTITPAPEARVALYEDLELSCSRSGTASVSGESTWVRSGSVVGVIRLSNVVCRTYGGLADNLMYGGQCLPDSVFKLTIKNVTLDEHHQNWSCGQTFTSIVNSEATSVYVTIPVTSVTLTSPAKDSVTVSEYSTLPVECETSQSRPTPTIEWYVTGPNNNDAEIATSVSQTPQPALDNLAVTRGILQYKVSRQVSGWSVYCKVNQRISQRKIKLSVTYPPTLFEIQGYQNGATYLVMQNRQQRLTCRSVGGNPLPTLTWSCFDGSVTDSSSGTTVEKELTWTSAFENGTCTCSSSYLGTTVTLNVVVLKPVTNVKFYIRQQTVPNNARIIDGSLEILTCSASGSPVITYRWRNGQSGSQITPTADGQYTCIASNTLQPSQGASVTTNSNSSIEVIMLYASKPVIHYNNRTGPVIVIGFTTIADRTFTMYCESIGVPPASTYTWSIGNSKTQLLTVSKIQRDVDITCTTKTTLDPTVGGTETHYRNKTVSVEFLRPPTTPVISYHYSSTVVRNGLNTLRVIEGQTFSISCSSTGKPNPTVTWLSHGTSVRIQFTAITRNETGEYTCVARNSMNTSFDGLVPGTSLNNISIHVLYPPVVQPLQDVTVIEGRSPDNPVICRVTPGYPSVTKIIWLKDNEIKAKQSSNVLQLQLPLTTVSRVQDGVYVCVGENTMNPTVGVNRVGNDSQYFRLTVYYEASVKTFGGINQHDDSQELTVNENDETNLRCITDSKPGSTISITRDDDVKVRLERTNELLYKIETTSCLDAGLYTCIGYNDVINQTSRPKKNLQLHVRCSPRLSPINETAFKQTSTLNTTTSLQVYILAYPTLTVTHLTWKKRSGSEYVTVQGDRMRSEISHSAIITTASLVIQDVQQSDFGEYLLHVEHEIQNTNITIFFVPKDKPSTPTDLGYKPEQLTTSSVVIYWSPGYNGGFPQRFIITIRQADGSGVGFQKQSLS